MSTTPLSAPRPSSRPATIVKMELREDVAILTMDDPAEVHNTITPAFGGELTAALASANADVRVKAVVLRSGKPSTFVVGANIDFIRGVRFATDAEEAAREAARRFGALEHGPVPVVAYVHGAALGGGFELALACTAAVASDDPETVFGLPEVKLGLIPAANGLLRIAERAGLRRALELGTTGRNLRATEAKRLGLVDDVTPHAIGLDVAIRLARELASNPKLHERQRRRRRQLARGDAKAQVTSLFAERTFLGRRVLFDRARKAVRETTRGHYPAPMRIIELLERFGARGFRASAELEPRLFGDLVVSETAHRLIDVFYAETALRKDSGLEPTEPRPNLAPIREVGVVGAGLMGAAITAATLGAGVAVRLKDRDEAALGRGLRFVHDQLGARRDAREVERAMNRLSATTDYSGFRHADVVVEAVFEVLEPHGASLSAKSAVIREIEKVVEGECVIASSTFALPISPIAEQCREPSRIVGMHYRSPWLKESLVEVVRTRLSEPRAVTTAVGLARRQGKRVIVVRDAPGHFTSRILVPYFLEALHLIAEGSDVAVVDRALVDWGFSMGPFELMDTIGIDIAAQAASVVSAASSGRLSTTGAFAKLIADDRRGRKNARGFYSRTSFTASTSRPIAVDATVYDVLKTRPEPKRVPPDEIALRCSIAMVSEVIRAYTDEVVRSPRDADLGAIFGVGFPAFRGGPFRYVDVLGPTEVLRRARSLEHRFGARFEPAPLLVEMARAGRRFFAT